MAEELVELRISDLYIGTEQHRTDNVGKEVEELAESIKIRGLLQPIRVVPGEGPNLGKYAVVTGQRRFLACANFLKWDKIPAIISVKKEDELEYLIDSITENTMRLNTTSDEDRRACIILNRRYGDIKSICHITGLSEYFVRKHLKWDNLPSVLKLMVDKGEVSLDAADKAVVVAKYDNLTEDGIVELAKSMNPLDNGSRNKVQKIKKANQSADIQAIIRTVEKEATIPIISVKLTNSVYKGLVALSKDERSTPDEVASNLITEKLSELGYNNEEY